MAQCRAKTKEGTKCSRDAVAKYKYLCTQHGKARLRLKKKAKKKAAVPKKKKKRRRRSVSEKRKHARKKRLAAKMKKLQKEGLGPMMIMGPGGPMMIMGPGGPMMMGPDGPMMMPQEDCGDPSCRGCAKPAEDILGFAQERDKKILELYNTTDKPLWDIARLANVDEGYVMRLCESFGFDRECEIGGPDTWAPLVRPKHPGVRRYPSPQSPSPPTASRHYLRRRRNPIVRPTYW